MVVVSVMGDGGGECNERDGGGECNGGWWW